MGGGGWVGHGSLHVCWGPDLYGSFLLFGRGWRPCMQWNGRRLRRGHALRANALDQTGGGGADGGAIGYMCIYIGGLAHTSDHVELSIA